METKIIKAVFGGTGNKLYDNGIRVCNTVSFITGYEYVLEVYSM